VEDGDVGALVRAAFIVMVKLGGPPLLAAMAVGLFVSLVQAVTQINEQTLAFVPKIAAVVTTLLLLGGFMSGTLVDFTRMLAVGGS
jgi:flagellar biosynthetic protein FliQ